MVMSPLLYFISRGTSSVSTSPSPSPHFRSGSPEQAQAASTAAVVSTPNETENFLIGAPRDESETESVRERRRRQESLPSLRPNHVSIVSRTIFVGHLHKQLAETRLQAFCEAAAHARVLECNLIPPRGCAFITFETRAAAARARRSLDRSMLEQREMKTAWAANLGVRRSQQGCHEGWNEREGCTYLPLEQVASMAPSAFRALLEGHALIDADSMPLELRLKLLSPSKDPPANPTKPLFIPPLPTSGKICATFIYDKRKKFACYLISLYFVSTTTPAPATSSASASTTSTAATASYCYVGAVAPASDGDHFHCRYW